MMDSGIAIQCVSKLTMHKNHLIFPKPHPEESRPYSIWFNSLRQGPRNVCFYQDSDDNDVIGQHSRPGEQPL